MANSNALLARLSGLQLERLSGPLLILIILAMMMLPLPPFILDVFFTFNIVVGIIILVISLYTTEPLECSVFPTLLLVTALLRLSLNIASTRVILTDGHKGAGAAGKVIEAFGHFLIGGNYVVGIVVFVILIVINFVVITKGAGWIAEVSARFTLDAMPGKQMAIDADLNSGFIDEQQAKLRRKEIQQEADFFGSMDGASKFVRGDAVAGIVIMLINLIAGMIVGMVQHDLPFARAVDTYTMLTIGDGLVAQIPALVISVAAGLVVTRVADDQDLSGQFVDQMFRRKEVLYITGTVLLLLGMIPGMPNLIFLLFGGGLFWGGWWLDKKGIRPNSMGGGQSTARPATAGGAVAAGGSAGGVSTPTTGGAPTTENIEVSWDDVAPVDILGLEVGYRLIPLVDRSQDGELLRRIRGIRKKIAQDVGFLVPSVHIRDNLELKPNAYRITLKGVDIAQGEAYVGMFLAINPGRVLGEIAGQRTQDPTFGLPAVWIDARQREQAQTYGYTVVDASTVVGTHISNIIQTHAHELLGRDEVQQLLDHVAKESPKLVEDVVPKLVSITTLQKVLQNLLAEEVHIRDMRSILQVLAEMGGVTQDTDEITAQVRVALGRAIVHSIYPGLDELPVLALDPGLENILLQATGTRGGEGAGLEPGLADSLLQHTHALAQQQEQQGIPAILLTPPSLRLLLSRFLRRAIPGLRVLAHTEIPDNRNIRVVGVVGGEG